MRFQILGRALAMLPFATLTGCAIQPEPLSHEDLSTNASNLTARVVADQEPINRTIDLFEATARALKYNLDHKVERYDEALRSVELRAAHAGMLPTLVSNAALTNRNNDLGSSSYNLVTQAPNFGFSTSQDRRNTTADLVFGWNILDFGLSYVRAQQAADKVLIAGENRRKVMHRVLEEVRTAYWKAVSAERLDTRLRSLEQRVKRAMISSKALAGSGDTSPITAITYRRELIEVLRTVQELRRDLSLARHQLAALMNVRPGTTFKLQVPSHAAKAAPIRLGADSMTDLALNHRPELREVAYRQRINQREARAALLELLPGIQLFAGTYTDHNSYLLNTDWVSVGAKASWNVMKLFTHRDREAVIAAQDDLLDQRALALTMAVMTQVHVSRARYDHFAREQETARDYLATQAALVAQIRTEHAADRVSEQTLLREELNELVAEVRADMTAASVEASKAAVFTAIGHDLIEASASEGASVKSIADGLRRSWALRSSQSAWGATAGVAK